MKRKSAAFLLLVLGGLLLNGCGAEEEGQVTIKVWESLEVKDYILTTMNTISPAIYDAAAMDGAGRGTAFRKLVLPLIVKRTTPFIVLAFTQNMNNFTTVFFLTEGNPALANTTTTSAGGTDLLVTWIYNLTFNLMKFNYASVITVVLFVVLVPIAVWQFKKTGMYRREQ